jgi:hypothetical protein
MERANGRNGERVNGRRQGPRPVGRETRRAESLIFCIKRIRAGFELFRGTWHPLALANRAGVPNGESAVVCVRLKTGAGLFSRLTKSWARRVFRLTGRGPGHRPIAPSPFPQPNLRSPAILTIPRDRFVPRRPYKRRHRSVLALRNGRLH